MHCPCPPDQHADFRSISHWNGLMSVSSNFWRGYGGHIACCDAWCDSQYLLVQALLKQHRKAEGEVGQKANHQTSFQPRQDQQRQAWRPLPFPFHQSAPHYGIGYVPAMASQRARLTAMRWIFICWAMALGACPAAENPDDGERLRAPGCLFNVGRFGKPWMFIARGLVQL